MSPTVTTIYTVTGVTAGNCSGSSAITVSVVTCQGFEEFKKEQNTINIFPNPNNGISYIYSSETIQQVIVKDAMGRTIYFADKLNKLEMQLDLVATAAGLYFVSVKTNSGFTNFKMVKNSE